MFFLQEFLCYLSCQRRLASRYDATLLDASLRWHDKKNMTINGN
jgi:hypothetical protein